MDEYKKIGGVILTERMSENIKEALIDIENLKLSSLLNEELERSRNSVLYSTLAAMIFMMFELTEFSFGGVKLVFSSHQEILVAVFLIFSTISLSIYYHINARAEFLGKRSSRAIAKLKLRELVVNIKADRKIVLKVARRELATNREHLDNPLDPFIAKKIALNEMKEIIEVEKMFRSQLFLTKNLHLLIIFSCLSVELFAFYIRYRPNIDLEVQYLLNWMPT